jgi:hypothetical protein
MCIQQSVNVLSMLALTPNFLGDNSLLIMGWGWGSVSHRRVRNVNCTAIINRFINTVKNVNNPPFALSIMVQNSFYDHMIHISKNVKS